MTYLFEPNKMKILLAQESDKKAEESFTRHLRSLIPKSFQVYKEHIHLEPTKSHADWLRRNWHKSPKPNFTQVFQFIGKARYGGKPHEWTPIYSIQIHFFFSKRTMEMGLRLTDFHLKPQKQNTGPAKMLRMISSNTITEVVKKKGQINKKLLSKLIEKGLKSIGEKTQERTIGIPLYAISRRKDSSWAKMFNDMFSKLDYAPKYEQPVWIKAPEWMKLGWVMKQMKQGKYGAPKRIRDLFSHGSQIRPNLMVSKEFIEPLILASIPSKLLPNKLRWGKDKKLKPMENMGQIVHNNHGSYQIIGIKHRYQLGGGLEYRTKLRGGGGYLGHRTKTDPLTGQQFQEYGGFSIDSKVYPLPGRNILIRRNGKHILELSDLDKTYQRILTEMAPKIIAPSIFLRKKSKDKYEWNCVENAYINETKITIEGDELVYHIDSDAFEFIIKIRPPFSHHLYWDITATCSQKPASYNNQRWPRFLSKVLNNGKVQALQYDKMTAASEYKDKNFDLFANLEQVIINDINPWLKRSVDFIKHPEYIGGKLLLCLTSRSLSMLQLKTLLKNMGFSYRTLSTAGVQEQYRSCVFDTQVTFKDTKQNRDAYAKYFVTSTKMENGKIIKDLPFLPNRINEYSVIRLDKVQEVTKMLKELK